ncbi:MAG: Maf family protein [bacterium]
MSKDILYLGSQSKPRQKLLDFAQITYKILQHKSEENVSHDGLPFEDYVLKIAQDKMKNLSFDVAPRFVPPHGGTSQDRHDDWIIFVLTSDTVARMIESKMILKKPLDLDDAKRLLIEIGSGPAEVFTACCLDKKRFENNKWETIEKNHFVVRTEVEFCIQPDEIDWYLKNMPQAINACGATIIEDFGFNFLKSVNGSYTSVLGLPLYEVRQALRKMDFRF